MNKQTEEMKGMCMADQKKFWSARPIQVGDQVGVRILYTDTESVGKKTVTVNKELFATGKVVSIKDRVYAVRLNYQRVPSDESRLPEFRTPQNDLGVLEYGTYALSENCLEKDYSHCGNDPFAEEPVRINFYNKSLESVLADCGYGKRTDNFNKMDVKVIEKANSADEKPLVGMSYGGCNFDPYVTDRYGTRHHYQRGLVWTEQQKRDLIDSIYNWIEIGKVVFRYKSWTQVRREMLVDGHGYNYECVDGKQRINAVLEFVQGKFADSHGNYWDDLSANAKRRFLNYDRLTFGKLEEGTKDSDVLRTFLTMNHTGVPMSAEHIKFVQSINDRFSKENI